MAYRAYILDSSKSIVAVLVDATWTYTETLNVSDILSLESAEVDKFAYITETQSFVRLVDDEDSDDVRTYRLHKIEEVDQDGRLGIRAEGDRIWQDMAREVYAGHHPFRGASVAAVVGDILSHSQFQLKSGGSAESDTTEIDNLELSYLSCLEALQRVADETGLEIEIDESTLPASIDLKTRGADNGVRLEYPGNASGIIRREKRDQILNKVYPIGGGDPPATCKFARFEILSWADPVLTVKGDKCVPADDALNGYYIQPVTGSEAGNQLLISDSSRGSSPDTDTLTISGSPSLAAGDWFYFRTLSQDGLDYVPNAVSQSAYGTFDGTVRDTSIEDVTSLAEPSFLDGTYTSGVCEGWANTGGATLSKNINTTYIQHGSASQRIQASGAGQGISRTVTGPSAEVYSLSVRLFVASGSVEIKVTGGNGETYLNHSGTSGVGWLTLDVPNFAIGGSSVTLWIRSADDAAECYVDAVAFTDSAQPAREFVRYNGARALYRLGFDALEKRANPITEYEIPGALDLHRADPDAYPFHALDIGDTATAVDPKQSLASAVRVLTISRNQNREALSLTLSSRTDLAAAFGSLAPELGQIHALKRDALQIQEDTKAIQQVARDYSTKLAAEVPTATRGRPFDGTIKSTGQTSVNISAGTIRIGDREQFAVGSTNITGLSADSVYYLYFDKGDAASGIQASTDIADAMGAGVIFITIIKTGATSLDRVQVFQADQQVDGEIWTRGVEVYDDSDSKRMDAGELQDLADGNNPSDWGLLLNEGVVWQEVGSVAEWTGGDWGMWRRLSVDHNSGADTTTTLYGDYVSVKARIAAGKSLFGRYSFAGGHPSSAGTIYAHYAFGKNEGTGTAYGVWALGEAHDTGAAYGVSARATGAVGASGDIISLHVYQARHYGSGDAYGLKIEDSLQSASGTAWAVYCAATEQSYFAGSVSIAGVAYTWPGADGSSGQVLTTDGAGTLSWSTGGGGVTDHGALTGLGDDDHTQYLLAAGTRGLSGAWNAGNQITATTFVSSAASGQPYACTSTTLNTNLNADLLDGSHASAFAAASHNHGAGDITSGVLVIAQGGTGASSYANQTFLKYDGVSAIVPSGYDHGSFASSVHTHDASDITSGYLALARGGTFNGSYTDGQFIMKDSGVARFVSSGYSAASFAAASHNHASSDITSGVLTQIQAHTGTYTSLNIWGSNNSYAGIYFSSVGASYGNRLMVATGSDVQGFYREGAGAWSWYFSGGALTVGTVPVGRITGTLPIANGGTGASSYANQTFLKYDGVSAIVPSGYDQGSFASSVHTHPASDITSGYLALARGGTFNSSYTDNYLIKKDSGVARFVSSIVQDNGTNVGIGMSPTYKLDVGGDMRANWIRTSGQRGLVNGTYSLYVSGFSTSYWDVQIGTTGGGFQCKDSSSTVRGYVYWTNGNDIGFLNNSAGWMVRGASSYVYLYPTTIGLGWSGSYPWSLLATGTYYMRMVGPNASGVGLRLETSGYTTCGYVYGTTGGNIGFLDDDAQWSYQHVTDSWHRWLSDNSELMRLDTAPCLMINSTSKLGDENIHIRRSSNTWTSTSGFPICIYNTHYQGQSAFYLRAYNHHCAFRGDYVGNVFVEMGMFGGTAGNTFYVTTGSPAWTDRFHVTAAAVVGYSGGTWHNPSDRRHKRNIQPIGGERALDMVLRLEGIYFNWRREHAPSDLEYRRRWVGMIAQDVFLIVPEVVDRPEESQEAWVLHHDRLMPVVIEAFKEHTKRSSNDLDQLRERASELQARIEALEELAQAA